MPETFADDSECLQRQREEFVARLSVKAIVKALVFGDYNGQ